jgi:hypothetical protein
MTWEAKRQFVEPDLAQFHEHTTAIQVLERTDSAD